ncbi:MAG: hypothetical protein ABL951_06950 [Alphaproteobacteria bacterium]
MKAGASSSQDFEVGAGMRTDLSVLALDANGAPVDLAAMTEITWRLAVNRNSAAIITKLKSLGGVTLSNSHKGVTYLVQAVALIRIDAADGVNLAGNYVHDASVTFADGAKRDFFQGKASFVKRLSA